MKIAFHDNALSLRGTTVALYDYAFYARELLNINPIITFNTKHASNDSSVIEKFKKEFEVYGYDNIQGLDYIIDKNKVDKLLLLKGGQPDGVMSKNCKNLINAIAICNKSHEHGDVFAMGSKWLSKITDYKIPYVPYMINLPEEDGDMREELNIPKTAIVLGRNGGYDTFDLNFVKTAIIEIINTRTDMYFIFQNTEKFMSHERVIFLDGSADMKTKVKFINTCDMMLHARYIGESFGLSCGEFSVRNKPVITWIQSPEKNHIDTLGDKGFYYNDKEEIKTLLLNISINDIKGKDWNCYIDNTPKKVMEQFNNIYIKKEF